MLPRLWQVKKFLRPPNFQQRHFSSNSETVQVYVLDPKILFGNSPSDQINSSKQDWQSGNAAAPYVQVSLPRAFLAKFSDGQFQLGEMDEPGNSWVFGEEGELFEQKLLGSHKVNSGFTSVIAAEAFDAMQRGPDDTVRMNLPTWSDFTKIVTGDDITWPHPRLQPLFLFAGTIVESDTASVYRNPASGASVTGLVISTHAEGVD
ncbi:TPA: hypothetical protein ACH3X1_011986 [Trebouxia sp. C0004]